MAANPYHVIRNETATPMDLWDRGYRRCLGLLQKAKNLMPPAGPAQRMEKARMLHDAFAIVEFWMAALPPDPSVQDTDPRRLEGLPPRLRLAYGYVLHRIVKANMDDRREDVDEAIAMLNHLSAVFHQKTS